MPGFNGTGPSGQGPGTGWGQGPCGVGRRKGFSRFARRDRGFQPLVGERGRPRWGRRAYGYRSFGPGEGPGYRASQDEAQALKEKAACLQSELEAIQRRLAELESA
jgi:hypothetical protein